MRMGRGLRHDQIPGAQWGYEALHDVAVAAGPHSPSGSAERGAMAVFRSGSGSWHWLCLHLCLAACTQDSQAAPDFTVYLHKILRNHTSHACDGNTLSIACPSKTSVTVLSAFYGRRIPSAHLCPAQNANNTEESTDCVSPVAVQKVMDECQDRRACRIRVTSRVFGVDPCPQTSKYLIVSHKCRPENHRSKLVCENERLRLSCKNSTVLAIYSATFGHQQHGNPDCPQETESTPDMECLSPSALRRVSRRCHGRTNCSVVADTQSFGDPCYPGVKKHLRVSFTCVPRYLLEDVGRGSSDPFSINDYTHGLPEKVTLYFVSGICAGLVFLLCLFGLKSTLVRDMKDLVSELEDELKAVQDPRPERGDDFDDDTCSESSFRRLTRSYHAADIFRPELTVEMEERNDEEEMEKELPNGDIWIHRDASPYAIHKIKALTA